MAESWDYHQPSHTQYPDLATFALIEKALSDKATITKFLLKKEKGKQTSP